MQTPVTLFIVMPIHNNAEDLQIMLKSVFATHTKIGNC